ATLESTPPLSPTTTVCGFITIIVSAKLQNKKRERFCFLFSLTSIVFGIIFFAVVRGLFSAFRLVPSTPAFYFGIGFAFWVVVFCTQFLLKFYFHREQNF